MSPNEGKPLERKDPSSASSERILKELRDNSKELFKTGDYKGSKKETKRLEKEIDQVKKQQEKALSEFGKLRKNIDRKEKQGYDVGEARSILEEAKEALAEMDFGRAFELMEDSWTALERSLFLPFPLLKKNVSLRTVIRNDVGRINFTFQIINRMDSPLGEILINLSTPQGFKDLPEKKLGVIRPKESRSVEAILKSDNKIERNKLADLILNNKIILTSNLDCAYKYPIYKISIKNISERPLKNITLRPFIPESLDSRERKKVVEWLEPSATASVTFKLYPKTMEREMMEEEEEKEEEKEEEEMEQVEEESEIPEEDLKEEVKDEEEFLRKGSNYLLEGKEIHHSYSIFAQYFSKQKRALVVTTTPPNKIAGEFGVEVSRENLIWLSNIDSDVFQVVSPTEIHAELVPQIKSFVEENEEGVIFIDKLERMKVENGFDSTLEFLKKVWGITREPKFTLLVHVDPNSFSENELKDMKDELRLYQVA
ncbi:MAG: DUF835 domain-containing protein [Candidatus Natronoplasma sp.]